MFLNRYSRASRPPAEAPMPTIGKPGSADLEAEDLASAGAGVAAVFFRLRRVFRFAERFGGGAFFWATVDVSPAGKLPSGAGCAEFRGTGLQPVAEARPRWPCHDWLTQKPVQTQQRVRTSILAGSKRQRKGGPRLRLVVSFMPKIAGNPIRATHSSPQNLPWLLERTHPPKRNRDLDVGTTSNGQRGHAIDWASPLAKPRATGSSSPYAGNDAMATIQMLFFDRCPSCAHTLCVPVAMMGQRVACRHCRASFTAAGDIAGQRGAGHFYGTLSHPARGADLAEGPSEQRPEAGDSLKTGCCCVPSAVSDTLFAVATGSST